MCRSWAVCACFYESNIYLAGVGHVTFKNSEQFVKDYTSRIGTKGLQNAIGRYLFSYQYLSIVPYIPVPSCLLTLRILYTGNEIPYFKCFDLNI
jgi:hypothetical protein